MRRVLRFSTALLLATATAFAEDPPVSKAEGFGATSKGGDGGAVVKVTTLSDSGAGSLREALAFSGPRIIRFDIDGTIDLKSPLRCTEGRVTIDGASAPGKGVTVFRHGIQFRGDCDDIVVKQLRIRVTEGGAEGDCITMWGKDGGTIERVLIDHCSLVGATDEGVNTWGEVHDVTVQWTIIAEGKNKADHPKGIHNYGWLSGVGSDRITIHHCLFASNMDRSPKVQGGLYDIVNNVIYNWSGNNASKIDEGARANVVGNFWIAGPRSSPDRGCVFVNDAEKGTRVFAEGNVSALTPKGTEDAWGIVTWYEGAKAHRPAPDEFRAKLRFEAPKVAAQRAAEARELVLKRAGPKWRDAEDERILKEAGAQ
ncbi:MAG: hypothetical protein FD180_274 [Planctomycetota bacterium]|nr:MAG: hypothetical protein FD180_274 [Planctomycetota bacterium]